MKNIKKFLVLVMAVATTLLCVACQTPTTNPVTPPDGEKPPVEDVYKFEEREIKTRGQLLTGTGVEYPDELWDTPDYRYETDLDFGGVGEVKGLFITSPIEYNGKKTKVAAYMGFPEGASKDNKVPAIVLVHGGLGTAIPDWVKYWNDHGFAAISIDTEGGEPINGVSNNNNLHKERNRYLNTAVYTCGPSNNGFSDISQPLNQQWFYHATTTAILANSLISSFDCVDTQKVGITGVSWGSIIPSAVVGYDDRFSFGMPIYGSVSLNGTGGSINNVPEMWDTTAGLEKTNCKMFFVNSMSDPFFALDANSRCAQASNGFILLKSVFPHGQGQAALEANLPYFAKYFCGMESEYLEIMQTPTGENPVIKYRKYGNVTVNKMELVYTEENLINPNTQWKRQEVEIDDSLYNDYILDLPLTAKHCFVHITYNTNMEVSTTLIDM